MSITPQQPPQRTSRRSQHPSRSLREILQAPGASQGPKAIVERFVYAERVTLLAAREKAGKSTIAGAIAAAVSAGKPFLDDSVAAGTVLYVGLEDHLFDTANRIDSFGANPDQLHVLNRLPGEPMGVLAAEVGRLDPTLVVIDTLFTFTESLGLDPSNAAQWTPQMVKLTRLARDSKAGVLIVHHGRKTDGESRDSTAIAAGVDLVLSMQEVRETDRRIKAKGRLHVDEFTVRFLEDAGGPRYELAAGPKSREPDITDYATRNPGASQNAIQQGVGGRADEVARALLRMEEMGIVENRGNAGRHRWFLTPDDGRSAGRPDTGSQDPSPKVLSPEPSSEVETRDLPCTPEMKEAT